MLFRLALVINLAVVAAMMITTAKSQLSEADKQAMLAAHRNARAGVSPSASNMMSMNWDEGIAASAQKYAETCPSGHSNAKGLGENLAWTWGKDSGAAGAVKMWVDEKADYDYNSNSCRAAQCGHYTQIVWATTTKVGCGFKFCNSAGGQSNSYTYVCQYSPQGNIVGQKPYETGGSGASTGPSSNNGDSPPVQSTPQNTLDAGPPQQISPPSSSAYDTSMKNPGLSSNQPLRTQGPPQVNQKKQPEPVQQQQQQYQQQNQPYPPVQQKPAEQEQQHQQNPSIQTQQKQQPPQPPQPFQEQQQQQQQQQLQQKQQDRPVQQQQQKHPVQSKQQNQSVQQQHQPQPHQNQQLQPSQQQQQQQQQQKHHVQPKQQNLSVQQQPQPQPHQHQQQQQTKQKQKEQAQYDPQHDLSPHHQWTPGGNVPQQKRLQSNTPSKSKPKQSIVAGNPPAPQHQGQAGPHPGGHPVIRQDPTTVYRGPPAAAAGLPETTNQNAPDPRRATHASDTYLKNHVAKAQQQQQPRVQQPPQANLRPIGGVRILF